MATPPKFIRFPFAATGDKEAIPDEAQASGSLSYSEGFGLDYERDPTKDAKAKRMPRGGTNQVLYDATSNIQQYQLYGVPYWYGAANNGSTAIQYQKNAMVRFASGSNENIYISLKDNNTDAPTVSASWFLFQPYNSTLLSRLSVAPFVPVESTTLTTPPTTPVQGKAYLIPANATGLWIGKVGQLAEWDGSNWLFTVTPSGHSIGLPDGRVFTKVDGTYIEKIALDSQSGKWNYATTAGTNSAYIINLSPQPTTPPASLFVKFHVENTGAATIKISNLSPIDIMRLGGGPLQAGDLPQDSVRELLFDGTRYQITTYDAKSTNVTGSTVLLSEQSLPGSVRTFININAEFPFGSLAGGVLTISQAGRYVFTLTTRVSVNVTNAPQNIFGNPVIYVNDAEVAVSTSGIFGNVNGNNTGLAATTTLAALLQVGDKIKVYINAGSLTGSGINNIKLNGANFSILKMD